MTRITPSERFRHKLDDALAGVDGEADPVETITRLGARLISQQALEAETELFLGPATSGERSPCTAGRAPEATHLRPPPYSRPIRTRTGSRAMHRPGEAHRRAH